MTDDPLLDFLAARAEPYLRGVAAELRADAAVAQALQTTVPPATVAGRLWRRLRARDDVLEPYATLFGEPAWHMLLALRASADPLMISGACEMSGGPPTTGLRYVNTLVREGLAQRQDDPFDGRRGWLSLTESGRDLVDRAAAAVTR